MKRTIANAFINPDDDSDEEEVGSMPDSRAKMPRHLGSSAPNSGGLSQKVVAKRSYYWLDQYKSVRPNDEFCQGNSGILGSQKVSAADTKLQPKFSSTPVSEDHAKEKKRVEQMLKSRQEQDAKEHFNLERRQTGGTPICHLCRRKFGSFDKLEEHEKVSELHKTNLDKAAREQEERRKALTVGSLGPVTRICSASSDGSGGVK